MQQRKLDEPVLVSIPRLARRLGVGVEAARELARQGRIPVVRVGARDLVPLGRALVALGITDDAAA